jgi:hypothetical protein
MITFAPDSQMTKIGDYAFYGLWAVLGITIPASVIEIGEGAFFESSILGVGFESNSALTTIGQFAFSFTLIYNLILPSSVTTIGKEAVFSCENLEFVYIPDTVTTIGKHAFDGTQINTLPLYVPHPSSPAGWDAEWYGSHTAVEWGTTRKVVMMTYAKPDDSILFIIPGMSGTSGTPLNGILPDENGFLGWFTDKQLTQPFTSSTFPADSMTIYGKFE